MRSTRPILVDDQVYEALKAIALPFETHNDAMRRVFKLPPVKRGRPLGSKNKPKPKS